MRDLPTGFFSVTEPVRHEGPNSDAELAFRWYRPDQVVAGRTMAEHLRFSLCYWHSLCWPGSDPFGGQSFARPWFAAGAEPMAAARAKAEVMFEMLRLTGVRFFTFHDVDAAPEGDSLAEFASNLSTIADVLAQKMEQSGVRLLWGTANLFSHRRYMAGAATNPDPAVFACAAQQVRHALETTHRLGGANYVLWGGREGYETLLNTDLKREMDQLGRFLAMVADHRHRIGFKGTLLIEPKPKEPTKHQYDYDVATVWGFLKSYGLENEYRINIEQNHAILAGHSFEHEVALAYALGAFGSLDINRGDSLLGWDTDQFAMNVPELTLMMVEFLKGGGFTTGGMNFDAKIRRQSIDPDDLLHAHVASMDAIARALLAADRILSDGRLEQARAARYAGWDQAEGQAVLAGQSRLAEVADRALTSPDPQPVSGRQERLEALVNRFV